MRIAFHAPMKPPEHPVPSGDRRMARLFLAALEEAGFAPFTASSLRLLDRHGDDDTQRRLTAEAEAEIARLQGELEPDPPALWFTYHCHYKAPDLIGPRIAEALGIPYVIAEASRARKRLDGPWAGFARAAEAAIDRADLLLAMSATDRFALDRDAPAGQRITDFPPFLDPGPAPVMPVPATSGLRLLTVAMMREGAKLRSYTALAGALAQVSRTDWTLEIIGDGPVRAEVSALFASFGSRVRFRGALAEPATLRAAYESADLFVWPGMEEAYGMVYLEAQAAGLPVLAEDHPGPRGVIGPASQRVPPGDAAAFARAIDGFSPCSTRRLASRRHVEEHHAIDRAARLLARELGALL